MNHGYVSLLDKASRRRTQIHVEFLKHYLLLAAMIFAVLVSLHTPRNFHCMYLRYIFPLGMSTLTLGILTGSVALYGVVDGHTRLVASVKESLLNIPGETKILIDAVPPLKIFLYAERVSYVSTSLALVLLVIYSFIIA
jgi:hypothetical protein